MWKKLLIGCLTLIIVSLGYVCFNYFLHANAAPTYAIGDTVYYANDTFTYVGTDGNHLLLLNNKSINDNLAWNEAKAQAIAYNNSLGNIGKTLVTSSLPTTNDLQQAAILNNGIDELHTTVPKISSTWWLGDIDLQANNQAKFLSENNKREHNQAYQKYEKIKNGVCQAPSQHTTSLGTGFINDVNEAGENVAWVKNGTQSYETTALGTYSFIERYDGANCSGTLLNSSVVNTTSTSTGTITQLTYGGAKQFNGHWVVAAALVNMGFIPTTVGWKGGVTASAGQCLNTSNDDVKGVMLATGQEVNSIRVVGGDLTLSFTLSSVTPSTSADLATLVCPDVNNSAYTASARPILKVPLNKVLEYTNSKPVIHLSNQIDGDFPQSDIGSKSYLTLLSEGMSVNLDPSAKGVSGNKITMEKPKSGTTITLPLTFAGLQEGSRYIAASTTDKDGNQVYGVLSAVHGSPQSVTLDYSNLITDSDTSLTLTLYVIDEGSGKTMFRSEGKQITVEFQQKDAAITFDKDDNGITYVSSNSTNTTVHIEHATHTNTDSEANDVDIVYTLLSDPSNVLQSGLPFTSKNGSSQLNLVFKANSSGTVEIQAEIPASSNYKAATTKKKIIVQLGLTGNYIATKTNIKAGSTEAKPPTSYVQGNRIGYVDVSGGVTPYTYTLPSGKGNNGSFYIDNSGNVYVNKGVGSNGLTPGDYEIEVEVTDNTSPTQMSVTVKTTITISAAELEGVGWEDPKNSGKVLPTNVYETTYDPSGEPNNGGTFYTRLIETTAGKLNNTVITYTLEPNPNDVLSISGSSTIQATVKKASDDTTKNKVKIKAHITGGIYGTTGVDTELIVNVKKYPQTIAFPDTKLLKLPVGGACTAVPAEITSTYYKKDEVIQYTSSNTSANAPFTINAKGEVCPTGNKDNAGSATLTGTLNGDDNYETATTETGRVIQIYVPGNIEVTGSIEDGGTENVTYTADTVKKKALYTSTNPNNGTAKRDTTVAQVSVSSSTFAKSKETGNKNADAKYFTVSSTGYILLNQNITAEDINNHGTGNKYYIQVDVTDSNKNTRTVDIIIVIENADADYYFVDPIKGTKLAKTATFGKLNVPVYTATYAKDGTIDVKANLDSTYSEVMQVDEPSVDIAEDVIEHNNLNHFNIENASDPDGDYSNGGDAYVKACMEAHDGYAAQCIYAKVVIEKADQDNFAFVNTPKWTIGKTVATITPEYNNKLSEGDVLLRSSDDTIAEVQPPIEGENQSFKTMGKPGTITLTATAPEDRNYKSKEVTTQLKVSEKPPTTLQLYAEPMTYGDENKKAKIISGYKKGISAYFYVDDTDILEIDSTAINDKERDKIKAVGSGQVTIKVCQTSEPFDPKTDDCNAIGGDYGEVTITVKKKSITLTYEDEEIYVGEAFPTYKFKEPSASAFAFDDSIADFPIPKNTSAKKNGTSIKDTKTKGSYDITGKYAEKELSGNTEHYDIKIESGTLTIKQDEPQDNWYHLENPNGDIVSSEIWHNYIVDVVIDEVNTSADAGTYDQISNTNTFTNVDKQRFTVTKEDDNKTDIYFRIDPNGTSPHKGAISEKIEDHVKIDMTNPKVVSITGYPVNDDGLSNLLNEITLGHYFKPGVKVEIKTDDPQPQSGKTVKVSGIKEVSYRVYELDSEGMMTSTTPIQEDTAAPGTNKILSFKINNIGNYRVCATTVDNATNESSEKCSDLNVKKIDYDVDGDGNPDFNDPDGDGCPDLNIKWKDPNDESKWIVINGDRNNDGIPDINIDSDGDGKPDLNIDTDKDGKPDLNLVILKKSDWKPTKCVKTDPDNGILEEYCTGTSVKAVINVDTDDDGIPNINIDNKGDFKPHINISKNDINPSINIAIIHDWKPDKNYKSGSFTYDSIGKDELKPYLNIDTDGDGLPDINLDLDGDGIADINIDTDGDNIPDVDIDSDGDGKPDINIDTDGDGKPDENIKEITEWKPEKNVDGEFPYDTMDFSDPSDPKDNKPNDSGNDTSVKGQYNPATSMGGANTGDETNLMLCMSLLISSLILGYITIRKIHFNKKSLSR